MNIRHPVVGWSLFISVVRESHFATKRRRIGSRPDIHFVSSTQLGRLEFQPNWSAMFLDKYISIFDE
jgi:hypothetical protein